MNEHLSIPGSRWGDPQFTDVFTDPEEIAKYRDSPLSDRGIRQAESLSSRLGKEDSKIIEEIELIAVSPLIRALQTMEISLYPNLWPGKVPIIALPQASERVYLISDFGTSTKQLKKQYPVVDFDTEIPSDKSDSWWISDYSSNTTTNYKEWRPSNDGQTYAALGEIESAFNERMMSLYDWLAQRPESTIALICHWGVLEWLTGYDFDNCEMRVIDFADMKRSGFMISDEEFNEIFKDGERSVIQDIQ